jgi:tetrapyrrole methylase family protein/MazG family protein
VLNAQIASETSEFHMADIIHGIYAKIVRRHPHVFGDVSVDGVKGVLVNWEKLKAAERENSGEANHKKGLLDGVPISFPALAQAHEIQDRAARVGFDWPDVQGVIDKILEEIEEIRNAPDAQAREDEFGDLFFALVNLARWEKVDAEAALRSTNQRFRRRFGYIEQEAQARGLTVEDLSMEVMDELWNAAKKQERE